LTDQQLAEAWRLCDEPTVCFDGDQAGTAAARRALHHALPSLRAGRSLSFATLPAGDDPDSLMRSHGAATLERLLAAAVPLSRALWQMAVTARSVDTPERRADLRKRLAEATALISDEAVQDEYRKFVRHQMAKLDLATASGETAPDNMRRAQLEALFRLLAAAPDLIAELAGDLAALDLEAAPDLTRLCGAMLAGDDWRAQLYNGLAATADAITMPAIGPELIAVAGDRALSEARRLILEAGHA
jgi:DNA primase